MEAARRGAALLLKYWQQLGKADAHTKARNDWVSAADRESELAIIAFINEQCPNDVCLGEESGYSTKTVRDRTWIIDPLDGTSNYLQHFPVWSISIALRNRDEIVAGVVYEPLRELFFSAERGAGAFRNGERMHVSDQAGVAASFLATGFPFRAQQFVHVYTQIFEDVISIAKGVRRAGSAAIATIVKSFRAAVLANLGFTLSQKASSSGAPNGSARWLYYDVSNPGRAHPTRSNEEHDHLISPPKSAAADAAGA